MGTQLTRADIEPRLNQVIAETYTAKRPELEALNFIPMGQQVNSGANSVSYSEMTEIGFAKIIEDYAKDLPPVAIMFKEKFVPVKTFGDSYSFSYVSLLNAKQLGIQLEATKASTARYGIEAALNEYFLVGNKAAGVTGFLNNENVTKTAVNVDLKTCTIDEAIGVFRGLLDAVDVATKGAEKPDSVIIPASVMPYLQSRRIDQFSDTRMLDFLKGTFPQIKNWYSSRACDDIGADGSTRIVLYTKDASAVSIRNALNFTQLPAQWNGIAATVNCMARSAGVIFTRPLSAIYGDKVDG